MEAAERELIETALGTNFEVKRMYDRHLRFEARLGKLGRRAYLTPEEESEQKALKVLKLRNVEKMLRLASPLRKAV